MRVIEDRVLIQSLLINIAPHGGEEIEQAVSMIWAGPILHRLIFVFQIPCQGFLRGLRHYRAAENLRGNPPSSAFDEQRLFAERRQTRGCDGGPESGSDHDRIVVHSRLL